MNKITLDAATVESLKSAEPGAELVGSDGSVIGAYLPVEFVHLLKVILDERRRAILEADAEVSLQELIEADLAGGGIPMAEVFKMVEKYGG